MNKSPSNFYTNWSTISISITINLRLFGVLTHKTMTDQTAIMLIISMTIVEILSALLMRLVTVLHGIKIRQLIALSSQDARKGWNAINVMVGLRINIILIIWSKANKKIKLRMQDHPMLADKKD